MGNSYTLFCVECSKYFWLGKENEWWHDKKQMYLLKDFLLGHIDHHLKVGGDEWNRAYDDKSNKQLPTSEYSAADTSCSEKDFADIEIVRPNRKLFQIPICNARTSLRDGRVIEAYDILGRILEEMEK